MFQRFFPTVIALVSMDSHQEALDGAFQVL
jgi:hypothetical protein